jgi:hypothetical protein
MLVSQGVVIQFHPKVKEIAMKTFAHALLAGGMLALASSAASAMDPADYRAEVAVADGNYEAAVGQCNLLPGEPRFRCIDRARIVRSNAVEDARARATTVVIIHPAPMPGTTPADRADAQVEAQQPLSAKP